MWTLTPRVAATALVAGALAIAGLAVAAVYVGGQPAALRIAVGPPGGEDVKLVQALAQQFARDRSTIRLRLVYRDNPDDSAAAVDSGKADLAVVRSDLGLPKTAQAVAILRRNVAVFVAPASEPASARSKTAKRKAVKAAKASKSKAARGRRAVADESGKTVEREAKEDAKADKAVGKITDLAGKRVGVLGRRDFNTRLLHAVLKHYDIGSDKVTIVPLEPPEATAAFKERRIDALLAVGPIGSPFLAEAVALAARGGEGPKFLEIGESEALAQRAPTYEASEIVAGTFGGSPPRPPESVSTIGFSHYIVASRSLSEQVVFEFARLLFGARQVLAAESQAFGKIQVPDTDKDAVVPVHAGAAAYVEGDQKTFFDRYGDFMYWGVMLLSFFGSAAAGFASYLSSGERTRTNEHLDRLVQIVEKARAADRHELDALQLEVDAILASTIRQAEGAKLSADSLAAFSLALDQARLAIEQRRPGAASEGVRRRPGLPEAIALR